MQLIGFHRLAGLAASVVTLLALTGVTATAAPAEKTRDKTVLVAITEDGVPPADGRPRLVVFGDKKGGRYVSSLVRLHLKR